MLRILFAIGIGAPMCGCVNPHYCMHVAHSKGEWWSSGVSDTATPAVIALDSSQVSSHRKCELYVFHCFTSVHILVSPYSPHSYRAVWFRVKLLPRLFWLLLLSPEFQSGVRTHFKYKFIIRNKDPILLSRKKSQKFRPLRMLVCPLPGQIEPCKCEAGREWILNRDVLDTHWTVYSGPHRDYYNRIEQWRTHSLLSNADAHTHGHSGVRSVMEKVKNMSAAWLTQNFHFKFSTFNENSQIFESYCRLETVKLIYGLWLTVHRKCGNRQCSISLGDFLKINVFNPFERRRAMPTPFHDRAPETWKKLRHGKQADDKNEGHVNDAFSHSNKCPALIDTGPCAA